MILRVITILIAGLSIWAIWYGYDHLRVLRGTVLWEFRYLVLLAATFLGLSGIEWALGWVRRRLSSK